MHLNWLEYEASHTYCRRSSIRCLRGWAHPTRARELGTAFGRPHRDRPGDMLIDFAVQYPRSISTLIPTVPGIVRGHGIEEGDLGDLFATRRLATLREDFIAVISLLVGKRLVDEEDRGTGGSAFRITKIGREARPDSAQVSRSLFARLRRRPVWRGSAETPTSCAQRYEGRFRTPLATRQSSRVRSISLRVSNGGKDQDQSTASHKPCTCRKVTSPSLAVNLITGPITTGKSSVLELIDYALGASNAPDYEELSKCSDVLLEIEVGGELLTLQRSLKAPTAKALLFESSLDDVLKGGNLSRSYFRSTHDRAHRSAWRFWNDLGSVTFRSSEPQRKKPPRSTPSAFATYFDSSTSTRTEWARRLASSRTTLCARSNGAPASRFSTMFLTQPPQDLLNP